MPGHLVTDRWYQQGAIYCLDVRTFQDSNGDGVGDLPGLISRLDYLERLGATAVWLNPVHPTPNRDDGYDVTDHYGIEPELGCLGDFADLLHEADNRGLRVIMDLVVNHTSDQHPWFQAARSDPKSPYRDWYVWSDDEPADRRQGMVFPGFQKETWTFDDEAGAWYYHRFYDFEPDLNFGNDDVRAEVRKIVTFWTRLGVAGFRVDAAPFIAELTRPNDDEPPVDLDLFDDLFDAVRWRRGDAVFLAEANVERDRLSEFFGAGRRFPMLFNFLLNARTFLALARADATPIAATLEALPTLHPSCQWTTFLRNHDEIDLSRLGAHEQEEVFAAFGPDPDMQLYDRGIRRRLAPMLGNDHDRVAMAYALLCSLPGTPMIRYGEEIGMGDDLSLPERNAIRTPMQWSEDENGGFSTARPKQLVRPVISEGEFGTKSVNVLAQRLDPESLLHTIESILHSRQECPELGRGQAAVVDTDNRAVHALRFEAPAGVVLVLVNLSDEACTLDLHHVSTGTVVEVLGNRLYECPDPSLTEVELDGYGYRWLRLAGPAPSHTTPR